MKYNITLFVLLYIALISLSTAQQVPTMHQFIYRPELYNPASLGIDGSPAIHLAHRQYWTGFEDAPSTSLVAFQGIPIMKRPFSLGATLEHDRAFVLNRTGLAVYPTLHLNAGPYHTLSLGISIGILNYQIDYDRIFNDLISDFSRQDPILNTGQSHSQYNLNAGVGVQYQYENENTLVRIGASATQLPGADASDTEDVFFEQYPHIMAGANIRFPLSTSIYLEPSVLYKVILGELPNGDSPLLGGNDLDLFARFVFPHFAQLGLGAGTRWDLTEQENTPGSNFRAINGMIGMNITPKTRLNLIAEIHRDLPITLEAGISFDLGESQTRNPEKNCDPLWRNPDCLSEELSMVNGLPAHASVVSLISSRRVTLVYQFTDDTNPYDAEEWSEAQNLTAHISQIINRMLLNQDELLGIQSIEIELELRDNERILDLAALVNYYAEYGNPANIRYTTQQGTEETLIRPGNINRKELALLKMISLQNEFSRLLNLNKRQFDFSLSAGNQLNSARRFNIQIVCTRRQN